MGGLCHIETYSSRDEWLRARRMGIGASDAAAIVGVSPFASPLDIYADKIGVGPDRPDETEAMYWGHALEVPIRQRYIEVTGRDVETPPPWQITRSLNHESWLFATLDGTITQADRRPTPAPLELKTVGADPRKVVATWMAEGPSLPYVVQVQHQMMVTGASWASLAALVGGNRFIWMDVERDEKFILALHGALERFWRRVVDQDPPPPQRRDRATLERLFPRSLPSLTVSLPSEMVELDTQREKALEEIKYYEGVKLEVENKFRAAIGDAESGQLANGAIYTWKHQERKEHVVPASSFRVLRRFGYAETE